MALLGFLEWDRTYLQCSYIDSHLPRSEYKKHSSQIKLGIFNLSFQKKKFALHENTDEWHSACFDTGAQPTVIDLRLAKVYCSFM